MKWGLLDRQEDRDYQYFDGVQICVCAIICKTKEICKSLFVFILTAAMQVVFLESETVKQLLGYDFTKSTDRASYR